MLVSLMLQLQPECVASQLQQVHTPEEHLPAAMLTHVDAELHERGIA